MNEAVLFLCLVLLQKPCIFAGVPCLVNEAVLFLSLVLLQKPGIFAGVPRLVNEARYVFVCAPLIKGICAGASTQSKVYVRVRPPNQR